MTSYAYPLLSVLIVSLISLVGALTLSLRETLLKKYIFVLVSLAVGALLGDSFIHLIPESFETLENPIYVSLSIIGGILIFFLLEKVMHWHHHGIETDETHTAPGIHPVGRMIILSDGLHNLLDGIIIGASYLVSVEVGIATTIAVILHEIPQEIGDFGVLLHAGYTKTKALLLNFLSALFSLVGVGIAFLLGNSADDFGAWLVPFAAGGFIYIALSDLMPELHKEKKFTYIVIQLIAVLFGVFAMFALLAVE